MPLTNEIIAQNLPEAFRLNQFELHYQPIVDAKTHKIVKAEALIRWNHPTYGTISPARFIPVAEQMNMIGPIGDWVFKEVVHYAEELLHVTQGGLPLSFNLSPMQFKSHNAQYFNAWPYYLAEVGLPAHSLCVEITEGLLLENDTDTMHVIDMLRYHGVDIAMDDFGTGHSALSYLKRFHFNYVKIHRSFIQEIGTSIVDRVVVEAVVMMADRLGFSVIAEGIETTEQSNILTMLDVGYCQGYLFSKPVPADKFSAIVEAQSPKPRWAL